MCSVTEQSVVPCCDGQSTCKVKCDENNGFDPRNSVFNGVKNDSKDGKERHSDEERGVDDVEGILVFHGTPICNHSFILSVVC